MQDCAFDLALVPRGLGRTPSPPPPSAPESSPEPSPVQGLGQDPEGVGQEPEGLGQAKRLPYGIKLVGHQPNCHHWLLAFVNGAKKASVVLHDRAHFDYQTVLNILAAENQSTQFFTFTGSEGTYLFAYDVVNGKHVIKLCADSLTLHHTPHTHVPWTLSKHSRMSPRGLGAIFKSLPTYIGSGVTSGGGIQINAIAHAVGGSWAELGTIDSGGNFSASDPTNQFSKYSDLQDTLNNWATNIVQLYSAGPLFGGFYYFGLWDTNTGGAQTPGEPPGMAILRFNGNRLDMLINEGGVAATGGPVLPVSLTPTWLQYAWIAGGGQGQPPAAIPPGASSSSGAWVFRPTSMPTRWIWYPMPNTMVQINGYWVYGNPQKASSWTSLPMPTTTPPGVAVGTGTWQQAHQAYWVWVPSGGAAAMATTAATGMSTGTLLLLGILGVGAIGGVGYLLLS